MYNEVSQYPTTIDELIFFHDVSINDLEFVKLYDELIAQQAYGEANALLEEYSSHVAYSAELYNLIENRIYALQSHLLDQVIQDKRPEVLSEAEPTEIYNGMIWV